MAHKLTTENLQHTKVYKYIFSKFDKKIGAILTQSHWTTVIVLAVIFLSEKLKGKRSVPLIVGYCTF